MIKKTLRFASYLLLVTVTRHWASDLAKADDSV